MHRCIDAYMHTCIHAYMHACMHTYIHTYIDRRILKYIWPKHLLTGRTFDLAFQTRVAGRWHVRLWISPWLRYGWGGLSTSQNFVVYLVRLSRNKTCQRFAAKVMFMLAMKRIHASRKDPEVNQEFKTGCDNLILSHLVRVVYLSVPNPSPRPIALASNMFFLFFACDQKH